MPVKKPEVVGTFAFPAIVSQEAHGDFQVETSAAADDTARVDACLESAPDASKGTALSSKTKSRMVIRRHAVKARRARQMLQEQTKFGNFSEWGARLALQEPTAPRSVSNCSNEDGASPSDKDNTLQRKWVVRILCTLLLVLAFGNISVWAVLRWGIDPTFHNANGEELFRAIDPLEEMYEHIAEAVLPSMKTWYREQAAEQATFTEQGVVRGKRMECAEYWQRTLLQTTNITHTDPAIIQTWLFTLGLHEHPQILSALGSMVTQPQSIIAMVERGAACAGANMALGSFLCEARENLGVWMFAEWEDSQVREWAPRALNWAAVLEKLIAGAQADTSLLFAIFDYALHGAMGKVTTAMEKKLSGEALKSAQSVYDRVAQSGFHEAVKKMSNLQLSPGEASRSRDLLQLSILEAADMDKSRGLEDNTLVGVALAARAPWPTSVNDHSQVWVLGKQWVEAFLAWEFAFTSGGDSAFDMVRLLVPSVGCAAEELGSHAGLGFLHSRLAAVQLTMLAGLSMDAQASPPWQSAGATAAAGKSNRRSVPLSAPSNDKVERMLTQLCGGKCHGDRQLVFSKTSPTDELDDEGFRCYAGFVLWVTVLIAGFGTEFFVAQWLLGARARGNPARIQSFQSLWLFAQLIFSLMLSVALGSALSGSYLGLPFLVAGLWKFGFPETYMFFFNASVAPHGGVLQYQPRVRRHGLPLWMFSACGWSNALNGFGMALHHATAAGMMCLLTTRCAPPARCIQNYCFPLVIQHWFVLTRYLPKRMYSALMILSEIYFEWCVFSTWECSYQWATVHHNSAAMLFSHWVLFLAAFVSLFDEDDEASDARSDTMSVEGDTSVHSAHRTSISVEGGNASVRRRRGTIEQWTDLMRSASSHELDSVSGESTQAPRYWDDSSHRDSRRSQDGKSWAPKESGRLGIGSTRPGAETLAQANSTVTQPEGAGVTDPGMLIRERSLPGPVTFTKRLSSELAGGSSSPVRQRSREGTFRFPREPPDII